MDFGVKLLDAVSACLTAHVKRLCSLCSTKADVEATHLCHCTIFLLIAKFLM